MTGRDLIIYILQNNLEDKYVSKLFLELAVKNVQFDNAMTLEKYAAKHDVGVETVKTWIKWGWICGVQLQDTVYILEWKD